MLYRSNQIGTVVSRNSITGELNGSNVNRNQYNVHVSVLSDDYINKGYVIGDPRGSKGGVNNLGNAVSANYRPCADNSQNIIAPAIKIASSYGKTGSLKYAYAQERCAAYQENGYPAGRWRVPTSAEIDYLIGLSENKHIPSLFSPGLNSGTYYGYWSGGSWAYMGNASYLGSSVRAINLSSSGQKSHDGVSYTVTMPTGNSDNYTVRYNNRNYTNSIWVRCVYDIWYWGDKPLNNNGQEVDKTGARATQWLGYNYMD